MATTEFQITDADIGRVLTPADGFLVSLVVTTPPPKYEVPEWDPGRRCWRTSYFVLRGSDDFRDLYCASPSSWGYVSKTLVINQSLGYAGDLQIVCVPRGAVFELTLSDVAIDKTIKTSPQSLAEAGQALLQQIFKEQAERELVRR